MSKAPSAITPAKKQIMLDAFKDGATKRMACGIARVAPRTFRTWMAEGQLELDEWAEECEQIEASLAPGEKPEWPKLTVRAKFYADVAHALAGRDLQWMRDLEATRESKLDGQWQRYAWLLERTNPGEFATNVARVEHTGEGGGPIRIEDRSASLADVAKVLEQVGALAQLRSGADPAEVPAARALLPAPRDS